MRRIMLSKEESVAISLIRILAVILIISCHILQALDNKLAWWLNVGVQIFFFISGYLVAIREIKDYNSWIIKRFKRVYQQYYLFVAIILLVYIMFFKDLLNIQNILAYLVGMPGILGSIKGLGHLWYVPVIMLCYLIVPLIESYKISSKQKSEFKFISKTITTFIFMQLLFVNWGGISQPE